MDNCIFCKIIDGQIPSFTVYEDEYFKVILDRFPASKGHMLILPKEHCADIFEASESVLTGVYALAKKMSEAVVEAFDAEGINIVQNNKSAAGQTVYHFHMHIIPRFEKDGIVLNQTTNQEITLDELSVIADKIKEAVK